MNSALVPKLSSIRSFSLMNLRFLHLTCHSCRNVGCSKDNFCCGCEQWDDNRWTRSFTFYQELLKEKSNPRLKGNRKGIIVKGKEFYMPLLNTFPTR